MIPVADGAGEVAALGEGVDATSLGLAIGDRVVPHFMPGWQDGAMTPRNVAAMRGITRPGSLAEYVVVPAAQPGGPAGAPGFCAGCGAAHRRHHGLECGALGGSVRPGSVVVILGTGGVSICSHLQFAKTSGATVIIASSSDEKLERAQRAGRGPFDQLPRHAGLGRGRC
jgi:NADPH:quinone reductase-like Zn-dependent oxidoreductase